MEAGTGEGKAEGDREGTHTGKAGGAPARGRFSPEALGNLLLGQVQSIVLTEKINRILSLRPSRAG